MRTYIRKYILVEIKCYSPTVLTVGLYLIKPQINKI